MVIIFLVVGIVLIMIASEIARRTGNYFLDYWFGVLGVIATIINGLTAVVLCTLIACGFALDTKIDIYVKENAEINTTIETYVESYKEHEKTTFGTTTDTVDIILMYPELKSDELISKQLDIYMENKKHIINLELEKANVSIYRRILYFGS